MHVSHSPTGGLFPPLPFRVPNTLRKETVDIRQRAVAGDEETETFTIGLARPFPSPRFTARVVRVEPDAPECLPAAMRTAFHVAPILVLLAESGITVGAGLVNHRAPLASPS